MKGSAPRDHGRVFEPVLEALVKTNDGLIEVRSPAVGVWRPAAARAAAGVPIVAGALLGELEILGVLHRIVAPPGASGVAIEAPPSAGEVPLGYGDLMLVLDPKAALAAGIELGTTEQARGQGEQGLVFASPLSGRFYARPAPGQASFVNAGDLVSTGQTVGLLEVMKTFNRITYGGAGLPERARVIEVVPNDETDLDAGDTILRLEPA